MPDTTNSKRIARRGVERALTPEWTVGHNPETCTGVARNDPTLCDCGYYSGDGDYDSLMQAVERETARAIERVIDVLERKAGVPEGYPPLQPEARERRALEIREVLDAAEEAGVMEWTDE